MATEGPMTDMLGGVIPLEATVFTPMNIILMISTIFIIAAIFYFIGKNKKEIVSYKSLLIEDGKEKEEIAVAIEGNFANETFADRINNWRPILWVIGLFRCSVYVLPFSYKWNKWFKLKFHRIFNHVYWIYGM